MRERSRRADRGFDFLGYRLSPNALAVARPTLERFATRALVGVNCEAADPERLAAGRPPRACGQAATAPDGCEPEQPES